MGKQVSKDHYQFGSYLDHARFNSIYHQMSLIQALKPNSVLEVGTGTNLLRTLVTANAQYLSVDLDVELGPDIVGAIPNLPLKDESFDVVACFQVLEHLPFELFETSIAELARISSDYVVISLPYARYRFQIAINVPRLKWRRFSLTIPHFFRTHTFNGEHYWVVGTRGYHLKRIRRALESRFEVMSVSSPFEKQEHIFFSLRKRPRS
jgi:hypothetical protein